MPGIIKEDISLGEIILDDLIGLTLIGDSYQKVFETLYGPKNFEQDFSVEEINDFSVIDFSTRGKTKGHANHLHGELLWNSTHGKHSVQKKLLNLLPKGVNMLLLGGTVLCHFGKDYGVYVLFIEGRKKLKRGWLSFEEIRGYFHEQNESGKKIWRMAFLRVR